MTTDTNVGDYVAVKKMLEAQEKELQCKMMLITDAGEDEDGHWYSASAVLEIMHIAYSQGVRDIYKLVGGYVPH